MATEQEDKADTAERRGFYSNGVRVPYTIIGAFVLVVGTSAVTLEQVSQLWRWQENVSPTVSMLDRRLSIVETRLSNVEYLQRRRLERNRLYSPQEEISRDSE